MAKVSKYLDLVGQVKDGIKVLDYQRVPKVSKTSGKKYSVGRLTVCFENNEEQFIDVSLDSWKKWSFIKRLTKLADKVVKGIDKKVKEIKQKAQEVLLPSIEVSSGFGADYLRFMTCYNSQTLKKLYRTLSKTTHPDMGGDAKLFNVINTMYRVRKYAIDSTVEMFNEFNDWDKCNFIEEVDFTIENADWDGLFASGRA